MSQGTITDPKLALAYMLQPRTNTITFRSARTGVRRTFKVYPIDKEAAKKDTKNVRFFVKFLRGADNENDYQYLGQILNGEFSLTKKSRDFGLNEQTESYVIFKAAFECLKSVTVMPKTLEVFHSGKCGRCGRKLTVPESVESGFGPECIGHVGGGAPCPLPQLEKVSLPVSVGGTAAPQQSMNFGQETVPVTPSQKFATGRPARPKPRRSAPAYKPQVSDDLDSQIREAVAEYAAENPEAYYQDGGLTPEQAYKVAYNMFRVKFTGSK